MMNIEIYDNFLSDDQYKQIHHLCTILFLITQHQLPLEVEVLIPFFWRE